MVMASNGGISLDQTSVSSKTSGVESASNKTRIVAPCQPSPDQSFDTVDNIKKKVSVTSINTAVHQITHCTQQPTVIDDERLESHADYSQSVEGFHPELLLTILSTNQNDNAFSPPNDIVAAFVVRFDTKCGNKIEWQWPADVQLHGIEFQAIPSGAHNVKQDTIFFARPPHVGLCAFANEPQPDSTGERGARMLSVGFIVSASHEGNGDQIWQHVYFLKQQANHIIKTPQDTHALQSYAESHFNQILPSDIVDTPISPSHFPQLLTSLPKSVPSYHPAASLQKFIKVFGANVFLLWKACLLKKRILFYTPPPMEQACQFVYVTSLLAVPLARSMSPKSFPNHGPSPLFCISVNDIDWIKKLSGGYVAVTSDRIFESKTDLYDLFIQLPPISGILSINGSALSSTNISQSASFASLVEQSGSSSFRSRFPSLSCQTSSHNQPVFTAAPSYKGSNLLTKHNYVDHRRYKSTLRGIMYPDGDEEDTDSLRQAGCLAMTGAVACDWLSEIGDYFRDFCLCSCGCLSFCCCLSDSGISLDELDSDSVRRGANGIVTKLRSGTREGQERLGQLWKRTQKRYRSLLGSHSHGEYDRLCDDDHDYEEEDDLAGRGEIGGEASMVIDVPEVNTGAMSADVMSIRSGRSVNDSLRSIRSGGGGQQPDGDLKEDSVEIELIGYFHNLTFNLLTTLRSILTSTASFHNSDEPVLLSPEHFVLLGLDAGADADFVVQLSKIYFDREVRVASGSSYTYAKEAGKSRLKYIWVIMKDIAS